MNPEICLERAASAALAKKASEVVVLDSSPLIGRSLVEDEMLPTAVTVMEEASSRGIDLLLPTDVVATDDLENPTRVIPLR